MHKRRKNVASDPESTQYVWDSSCGMYADGYRPPTMAQTFVVIITPVKTH